MFLERLVDWFCCNLDYRGILGLGFTKHTHTHDDQRGYLWGVLFMFIIKHRLQEKG